MTIPILLLMIKLMWAVPAEGLFRTPPPVWILLSEDRKRNVNPYLRKKIRSYE